MQQLRQSIQGTPGFIEQHGVRQDQPDVAIGMGMHDVLHRRKIILHHRGDAVRCKQEHRLGLVAPVAVAVGMRVMEVVGLVTVAV